MTHANDDSIEPCLAVTRVVKRYAGVKALDEVSLQVRPGEILCLAGENGSGKSTLIKVVAGVVRPDEGKVEVGGADVTQTPPLARMAAGVHVIYQDFSLFPNLSVAENIWLVQQSCAGRRFTRRGEGRAMAARILERIGAALDLDRAVEDLPVAQKQIVAIARAMVQDARLIIMDEPTTALTHREVERLLAIVRLLAAEGVAFIFVSHKLEEVVAVSDRVVVLRNGVKTLDRDAAGVDDGMIAEAMLGLRLPVPPERTLPAADGALPLLSVCGLGKRGAYEDVSFDLKAGEILGFAGLLGAGRTALGLTLFGAERPDRGTLRLAERTLRLRSIPDAIAHGIAYLPEDRLTEGLVLGQSIGDNITISILRRLGRRLGFLSNATLLRVAREWVARLKVATPSPALPAGSLSGGNQQRVLIARWIATEPRLLVLNRPTVGVDVGSKFALHEIIRDHARAGMAILVISDDLGELNVLCDRILIMAGGRLVGEVAPGPGAPERIRERLEQ